MSLQPKSKRLVTEEKLESEINQTVLDPDGELQTSLKSTYALKDEFVPGVRVVTHGDDPDYPRPDTEVSVIWAGSVEPAQMEDGDLLFLHAPPVPAFSAFIDFTTGVADWTPRYVTATATWETATDAASPSGSKLALTGTGNRRLLSYNPVDAHDATNVEIVGQVSSDNPITSALASGLYVRGSGGAATESGYGVLQTSDQVRLYEYANGVSTNLRAKIRTTPILAGQRTRIRLRAEGSRVMFKAWLSTEPEPEAWDYTAPATVSGGWVGAFGSTSLAEQAWDWIGVAVDGGTAPIGA